MDLFIQTNCTKLNNLLKVLNILNGFIFSSSLYVYQIVWIKFIDNLLKNHGHLDRCISFEKLDLQNQKSRFSKIFVYNHFYFKSFQQQLVSLKSTLFQKAAYVLHIVSFHQNLTLHFID